MATGLVDNRVFEVSGREALRSRDFLEEKITEKVPHCLQRVVSSTLNYVTGIAATKDAGNPLFRPSMVRETAYLLSAFAAGGSMIFGPWPLALLGSAVLVGAGRSLVSGTGHVLIHRSKCKLIRVGYDFLSAMLWLPSWHQYWQAHRVHHIHTATESDPDRMLLDFLGLMPTDGLSFLRCILSPRVHRRFFKIRVRALFLEGPRWRALIVCLTGISLISLSPVGAVWLFVASVLGYQIAAIAAWVSLHRWWSEQPEMKTAKSVAVSVTLGRLNLAPPTLFGLASMVLNVSVSSILYPGAGERNHYLHHGAWPHTLGAHCPYTRTALILAGVELRQTTSLCQMFLGAFNEAREAQIQIGSSAIDDHSFLAL